MEAIRSTPMAGNGALLSLPPLRMFMKSDTSMGPTGWNLQNSDILGSFKTDRKSELVYTVHNSVNPFHWRYVTVFQIEIHAIEICLRESLKKGYTGMDIRIFFNSQSVIKVDLELLELLSTLERARPHAHAHTRTHTQIFVWTRGHRGFQFMQRQDIE